MENRVTLTPAEHILDAIQGATVSVGYVENEEGLHLCFRDGRVLIIKGIFTIGLMRSEERLH